ncbi:MAG: MFS transporter [Acidimicrobiia bacterium]
MTSARELLRRTFSAFAVPNFRLYFTGQVISVSGSWMQRVAQAWLVLELTGSGSAVGAVTAFQFLPILVLAPLGGLIADRMEKRRVLYLTQTMAGVTAATLGVLVLTGVVQLWMVFALALIHGTVGAFDNPARHAFVMEMVGRSRLTNAVGLNSVLMNTARVIGPALGGLLIVTVGIGICFLINSVSYLFFIAALLMMRSGAIERTQPEPRRRGQLRQALAYVRSEPVLGVPLVMMGVIGLLTHEWEVVLPLLARFTFGGGADTFGIMFAVMGLGSVVGGLYTAVRGDRPGRIMIWLAYALSGVVAVAALAPSLWMVYLALFWVGMSATAFFTLGNSVVQLNSVPEMRGRVIALRTAAILGSRPLGAPVVGWIGEHLGPRFAIGVGAVAALGVAVWAHRWLIGYERRREARPAEAAG